MVMNHFNHWDDPPGNQPHRAPKKIVIKGLQGARGSEDGDLAAAHCISLRFQEIGIQVSGATKIQLDDGDLVVNDTLI